MRSLPRTVTLPSIARLISAIRQVPFPTKRAAEIPFVYVDLAADRVLPLHNAPSPRVRQSGMCRVHHEACDPPLSRDWTVPMRRLVRNQRVDLGPGPFRVEGAGSPAPDATPAAAAAGAAEAASSGRQRPPSPDDTGIWFVPTARSCPTRNGRCRFYRTNIDDGQGFTDISTFPVDVRASVSANGPRSSAAGHSSPASTATRGRSSSRAPADELRTGTGGGIVVDYPLVSDQWTGQQARRPLARRQSQLLGATRRQAHRQSAARGMVKLPIGDDEAGASTRRRPTSSRRHRLGLYRRRRVVRLRRLHLARQPGRLRADERTPLGHWRGVSAAATAWASGSRPSSSARSTSTTPSPRRSRTVGDGRLARPADHAVSRSRSSARSGLTWQAPNGFFVGGAAGMELHHETRANDAGAGRTRTTAEGQQGLPGPDRLPSGRAATRRRGAAAPPPPPPPAAGAPRRRPRPNRPPTVKASCNPCRSRSGARQPSPPTRRIRTATR